MTRDTISFCSTHQVECFSLRPPRTCVYVSGAFCFVFSYIVASVARFSVLYSRLLALLLCRDRKSVV